VGRGVRSDAGRVGDIRQEPSQADARNGLIAFRVLTHPALGALVLARAATAAEGDRDPAGVDRPYHDERTRSDLSI